MRLYSVPPPLNLIALPYDLLSYIAHAAYTRACCCKQKSVAPHPKHTQPSAGSASPQEDSVLKRKGADSEPTSRLQSALERRGTRVRLMSTDDSVQKGAFALFSQDEAERAEDTARHSWLHWLENNNIASTEMGKKEDQILAAVKRIFRDSVEMRGKVELVFAQIEELKLKSLEDRQTTRDEFLKLHKIVPGQHVRAASPHPRDAYTDLQRASTAPGAPLAAQPAGASGTGQCQLVRSQLKKVVNPHNVVRPLPPLPPLAALTVLPRP